MRGFGEGENSIFHTTLHSIWCTILVNLNAFKGRESVLLVHIALIKRSSSLHVTKFRESKRSEINLKIQLSAKIFVVAAVALVI